MKRLILLMLAALSVLTAIAQTPTDAKPVTEKELADLKYFTTKTSEDVNLLLTFEPAITENGMTAGMCKIAAVKGSQKSNADFVYYLEGNNMLTLVDIDDTAHKATFSIAIVDIMGLPHLLLYSYSDTKGALNVINRKAYMCLKK